MATFTPELLLSWGRILHAGGEEYIAPRRLLYETNSPAAISFRHKIRRGAIFKPADLFRDTGHKRSYSHLR